MLPSSLPLPHSWDFLLPAPDKVGRFRVRFRFQLILSKRFRFLQNFTASSFRFLRFLSNGMLTSQHKTENFLQKIRQVYCLDRYHKMGWLQPSLKVGYYIFFYCRSILVVLCRAVAIPVPGGKASPPLKKFRPTLLTKSGHLAHKIVI